MAELQEGAGPIQVKKASFCFPNLVKVEIKETFHHFAVWIKVIKLLVLKDLGLSSEHTNRTMASLDRVQTRALCCLLILFSSSRRSPPWLIELPEPAHFDSR